MFHFSPPQGGGYHRGGYNNRGGGYHRNNYNNDGGGGRGYTNYGDRGGMLSQLWQNKANGKHLEYIYHLCLICSNSTWYLCNILVLTKIFLDTSTACGGPKMFCNICRECYFLIGGFLHIWAPWLPEKHINLTNLTQESPFQPHEILDKTNPYLWFLNLPDVFHMLSIACKLLMLSSKIFNGACSIMFWELVLK